MDAILNRLSPRDFFARHGRKTLALVVGFFGTILLMLFVGVAFSGVPLGGEPRQVTPIYPIFDE